jgi:exonuclease III
MTIINLYAPNVSAHDFIKHTLKDLKAHKDSNRVVVGDFNTSLSPIDRSLKQRVNKEVLELNDTINQMDPTDVYRTFHSITAQYTLLSEVHGSFSKMDHILGHKTSLSKYRKTEITPCILSPHHALKPDLNNKKYTNN